MFWLLYSLQEVLSKWKVWDQPWSRYLECELLSLSGQSFLFFKESLDFAGVFFQFPFSVLGFFWVFCLVGFYNFAYTLHDAKEAGEGKLAGFNLHRVLSWCTLDEFSTGAKQESPSTHAGRHRQLPLPSSRLPKIKQFPGWGFTPLSISRAPGVWTCRERQWERESLTCSSSPAHPAYITAANRECSIFRNTQIMVLILPSHWIMNISLFYLIIFQFKMCLNLLLCTPLVAPPKGQKKEKALLFQ